MIISTSPKEALFIECFFVRQGDGSCKEIPKVDADGIGVTTQYLKLNGGIQSISIEYMKGTTPVVPVLGQQNFGTVTYGTKAGVCAQKLYQQQYQPTEKCKGNSYSGCAVGPFTYPFQFDIGAGNVTQVIKFTFSEDYSTFTSVNIVVGHGYIYDNYVKNGVQKLITTWSPSKWYTELHNCGAF